MDKVRTMMHEGNVPLYLWDKALYTSALLTNHSVTSAPTTTETPFEMWFEKSPMWAI